MPRTTFSTVDSANSSLGSLLYNHICSEVEHQLVMEDDAVLLQEMESHTNKLPLPIWQGCGGDVLVQKAARSRRSTPEMDAFKSVNEFGVYLNEAETNNSVDEGTPGNKEKTPADDILWYSSRVSAIDENLTLFSL